MTPFNTFQHLPTPSKQFWLTIVVILLYADRNVTNDTEFRGLLAYHIIPGLYDANQLAPNYPANNTVDTELGAILTPPQRVNFTAISNATDPTTVSFCCFS